MHRHHLVVLDLAGQPAVLAGHPDRPVAFLDRLCVVSDQYPGRAAQMFDDVGAHAIAWYVGVPLGP